MQYRTGGNWVRNTQFSSQTGTSFANSPHDWSQLPFSECVVDLLVPRILAFFLRWRAPQVSWTLVLVFTNWNSMFSGILTLPGLFGTHPACIQPPLPVSDYSRLIVHHYQCPYSWHISNIMIIWWHTCLLMYWVHLWNPPCPHSPHVEL